MRQGRWLRTARDWFGLSFRSVVLALPRKRRSSPKDSPVALRGNLPVAAEEKVGCPLSPAASPPTELEARSLGILGRRRGAVRRAVS